MTSLDACRRASWDERWFAVLSAKRHKPLARHLRTACEHCASKFTTPYLLRSMESHLLRVNPSTVSLIMSSDMKLSVRTAMRT